MNSIPEAAGVGTWLWRLHAYRNRSDYDDAQELETKDVVDAARLARRIATMLSALS
jgi:hypothetical protein